MKKCRRHRKLKSWVFLIGWGGVEEMSIQQITGQYKSQPFHVEYVIIPSPLLGCDINFGEYGLYEVDLLRDHVFQGEHYKEMLHLLGKMVGRRKKIERIILISGCIGDRTCLQALSETLNQKTNLVFIKADIELEKYGFRKLEGTAYMVAGRIGKVRREKMWVSLKRNQEFT